MAEDSLQMFGGDWTERKLSALDDYLHAYAKALSSTAFRRVYIDAFAGTGYREQRATAATRLETIVFDELEPLTETEPQRFLDGSAKIALRVVPAFDRFVFVEFDQDKAGELEKLKGEFPALVARINVHRGDANAVIRYLCNTWDKQGTRGVLFLDPFGMQVEWETVRAIAGTGCVDTWILFPFAANRLMTRYPANIPDAWRARLNALFGTGEWEQRFYKERVLTDFFSGDVTVVEKNLTFRGLAAYYEERLRSVFPVVAPNSRVLRTDGGQPLFQLFFAAANPGKGGAIALKIAKHILDHM